MSTFGDAKIGAVRRQRRTRPRHENGVLPAYAATPAKKYYVKLKKLCHEVNVAQGLTKPVQADSPAAAVYGVYNFKWRTG